MSWFMIIVLGVLLWGAVSIGIVAALRFATGGTFPAPRGMERVSCSNF